LAAILFVLFLLFSLRDLAINYFKSEGKFTESIFTEILYGIILFIFIPLIVAAKIEDLPVKIIGSGVFVLIAFIFLLNYKKILVAPHVTNFFTASFAGGVAALLANYDVLASTDRGANFIFGLSIVKLLLMPPMLISQAFLFAYLPAMRSTIGKMCGGNLSFNSTSNYLKKVLARSLPICLLIYFIMCVALIMNKKIFDDELIYLFLLGAISSLITIVLSAFHNIFVAVKKSIFLVAGSILKFIFFVTFFKLNKSANLIQYYVLILSINFILMLGYIAYYYQMKKPLK
jgi:hypothetical protein